MHYLDLQIGDEYYENVIKLQKFARTFEVNRLREKIDPKSWIEFQYITTVNAFYYGAINAIVFTSGILQGVFFSSNVPNYLNYGGIGCVVGHEITHGFDDRGRRRDYNGMQKLVPNKYVWQYNFLKYI